MSSLVSPEQLKKAARVLIAKNAHDVSVSNDLFVKEHQSVLLVISLNRIHINVSVKPLVVPLVAPIHHGASICVIVKDPQSEFDQMLEQTSLSNVKVMSISTLRKKYRTYERKRELFASADLFMADERVLHYLPKALGKVFFQRKKIPVSFRITSAQSLETKVNQLRASSTLHRSEGSCWVLKVATTDMDAEQVVQNVIEALPSVVQAAGGNVNINSLQLKLESSIALPIYQGVQQAPSPAEQKVAAQRIKRRNEKRAIKEQKDAKRKAAWEEQQQKSEDKQVEADSDDEVGTFDVRSADEEAIPDFGLMLRKVKSKKRKKRVKM